MPDKPRRPRAYMLSRPCFRPPQGAAQLEQALMEDSREMLAAAGLGNPQVLTPAALAGTLRDGEAALVVFSDVPALPLPVLEGAAQALREAEVALGPCADGGIYLLAWAEGLDPALTRAMCRVLAGPAEKALEDLTELLTEAQAEVELFPAWFRLSSERDFRVVDSMARLSVLSEDGEEDFAAERLRQWLEQFAPEQS